MTQAGGNATEAGGPGGPFGSFLPDWVGSPPVEFLVVVLVTAIGVVVSKYLIRVLGRRIAKRFRRQSVAQTVLRSLRLTIVLFFFFLGTTLVGVRLGNIVLSVTVFSAVLGIVLAPIIGSLISGLFVLADRPYEIGDMIELDDGTTGFIDDITIRYTKVFTLDNTFLVIPNSNVRDARIANYSAEDARTRLSLSVLVTYESDVPTARRLIERAALNTENVIEGGPDIRIGSARYPAGPTCYIDEYADHGVLLTLRYWAERPYKLLATRSRVQANIQRLFGEADEPVEFAYPHQHLVFDETSGEASVAVREATGAPRGEGAVVDGEVGRPVDSEVDVGVEGEVEGAVDGDTDGGVGGTSDGDDA